MIPIIQADGVATLIIWQIWLKFAEMIYSSWINSPTQIYPPTRIWLD
jgi:hypothetical protein